jgi:hypothetical protein
LGRSVERERLPPPWRPDLPRSMASRSAKNSHTTQASQMNALPSALTFRSTPDTPQNEQRLAASTAYWGDGRFIK